jgi:hypothetical protein
MPHWPLCSCPLPLAPCPLPRAPCPVRRAPCPVPHSPFPVPRLTCWIMRRHKKNIYCRYLLLDQVFASSALRRTPPQLMPRCPRSSTLLLPLAPCPLPRAPCPVPLALCPLPFLTCWVMRRHKKTKILQVPLLDPVFTYSALRRTPPQLMPHWPRSSTVLLPLAPRPLPFAPCPSPPALCPLPLLTCWVLRRNNKKKYCRYLCLTKSSPELR